MTGKYVKNLDCKLVDFSVILYKIMTNKKEILPSDYIVPLNMNGLRGRMMHMPSPKKNGREMLLVYGHHALLERWWGLVQNFNTYGSVTMPDLPGFGGMDSFYKIGSKPTIDAYADYLASFIKLKFKQRKITIIGISYGFVVATRMLQRHPELTNRVELLISAVGFVHEDDFTFTRPRMAMYRTLTKILSVPVTPSVFKKVFLNATVLRLAYKHTHNAKHKFAETKNDPVQEKALMDLEIKLWNDNDVRTHMATSNGFLHLDNCKTPVNIPVLHIYSKNDNYFDYQIIEQHMKVVFSSFKGIPINMKSHAPSILADKKASGVLMPNELRKILSKTS